MQNGFQNLKKVYDLGKSETKNNYSCDDFQSKKILSTPLKRQVVDFPHEIIEISSEITHESGQTVHSQETISDNEMHLKVYVNETPLNSANEKLLRPAASFLGDLEPMNTSSYLESRESDFYSSDSNVSSSPAIFDSILHVKKKSKSSEITTI